MGFGHWIMDHFWISAFASLIVLFAVHFLISWLLKPASSEAGDAPD